MATFQVRAITPADRPWVRQVLIERSHATRIVSRGRVHQADELPGFVAEGTGNAPDGADSTHDLQARCLSPFSPAESARRIGLVIYRIEAGACEVVSLDSLVERCGVGTALLAAVRDTARAAGCRRLWLITTNDNLHALRFYQKRGWVLVAVHANALEESRRLKPEIPLVGIDGIPLRDEIELEWR